MTSSPGLLRLWEKRFYFLIPPFNDKTKNQQDYYTILFKNKLENRKKLEHYA